MAAAGELITRIHTRSDTSWVYSSAIFFLLLLQNRTCTEAVCKRQRAVVRFFQPLPALDELGLKLAQPARFQLGVAMARSSTMELNGSRTRSRLKRLLPY